MTRDELIEGAVTYSIIGAFYEVYNTLGFGFLEHSLATQINPPHPHHPNPPAEPSPAMPSGHDENPIHRPAAATVNQRPSDPSATRRLFTDVSSAPRQAIRCRTPNV